MVEVKILVLLVALLLGVKNETAQNQLPHVTQIVLQNGCSDPQEELRKSDARRHPPVTDALLQTPAGVDGIDPK